jgi:hypothetical protein
LCYLVGGIDELQVSLEVVKPGGTGGTSDR